MTITTSNNARSTLIESIDTDDTQILIPLGDYEKFLRVAGDYMFAVLIDADDKEIVKIDLESSGVHQRKIAGGVESFSGGLVVERAQGGTSAAAWTKGAVISNEVTEGLLNQFRQQGVRRSIAYEPDGILTPAYANERVYNSTDAQVWQAAGTSTVWKLIAGTVVGWVDVTDSDLWDDTGIFATWDDVNEWWDVNEWDPIGEPGWFYLELWPAGGWESGNYYSKARITFTNSAGDVDVTIRTGNGDVEFESVTSFQELDFPTDSEETQEFERFEPIQLRDVLAAGGTFRITKIELYKITTPVVDEGGDEGGGGGRI